MGDINLIPGQQVKGQGRTGRSGASAVEYSRPTDTQPGWWERRNRARAAKRQAKAATAAVALAKPVAPQLKPKSIPPVAPPADVQRAVSPIKPIPLARPVNVKPDFISDAGFTSSSGAARSVPTSPKEAYYIRRHVDTSQPRKEKKKEPAVTHRQHQPSEPTVSLVDVNLIPKEFNLGVTSTHSWSELLRYAIVSMILVGVVYGGLRWYDYKLTSDAVTLTAQVATLDQQIAAYSAEREQATTLQDTLTGLKSILDQHVNYAAFFSFLEANTLPTVYYKSVNVDARTGSVTAAAVTSDFDQLRAQVAVLEDHPLVSNITVNSATRTVPTTPTGELATTGQSTLLYNITFTVDPSLFHP